MFYSTYYATQKAKKFLQIIFLFLLFNVYSVFADNVDGPDIYLKTISKSVEVGELVKVNVSFSESVMSLSSKDISVDGGDVESVRKLSSMSYLLFVRAKEFNKYLDIQIESGKVKNKNGVENNFASNAIMLKITQPAPKSVISNEAKVEISKVLDSAVNSPRNPYLDSSSQTPSTNSSQLQNQQTSFYNCNGRAIPVTESCPNPVQQNNGYYDNYGNFVPNNSNNYYNSPYGYQPYQNPYFNPYGYGNSYSYPGSGYYEPVYDNYFPSTNFFYDIFDW